MYYHGTKTLITDGYLKPHISFELNNWVYTTDDYWYALMRSGNFDISKDLVREDINDEGKIQLAEIEPGAFKYLFDRTGYIYKVNEEGSIQNRTHEFVFDRPVEIKETEKIENIWQTMIKSNMYELISYEDSDDYWKTVSGGKEGYLERRHKFTNAIKAMQNA